MEFSDVLWKFIESFVVALVPILVPLLAAWLLPKAIGAWKGLKSKLDSDDIYLIESIAGVAVKAAEQAKLSGFIQDKKTYAMEFVEDWLKARGVKLDLKLIDSAIEAAVLEEFNRDKSVKAKIGYKVD
jgi:hypothetical protein